MESALYGTKHSRLFQKSLKSLKSLIYQQLSNASTT